MKLLTDDNRKRISNVLFYIALTIELVLMIVEKSEIPFGYESHVFRVTFVLTLAEPMGLNPVAFAFGITMGASVVFSSPLAGTSNRTAEEPTSFDICPSSWNQKNLLPWTKGGIKSRLHRIIILLNILI